jgi:hypothetical protein
MGCLDTGATRSQVDRAFLLEKHPQATISQYSNGWTCGGVGGGTLAVNHYSVLDVHFLGRINHSTVWAKVTHQFDVVDDPLIPLLLGQDMIEQQGVIINAPESEMTITRCQNAKVTIVQAKSRIKQ